MPVEPECHRHLRGNPVCFDTPPVGATRRVALADDKETSLDAL